MLKYFNVSDHPKFCLETKENGLDSIIHSNKKHLYGTRQNKKGFVTPIFLLKYFNVFDHPKFCSETKKNGLDSIIHSNKKHLYGTRENKKGFLILIFYWNISMFLTIQNSTWKQKKMVLIVFWTQIRNNYMGQNKIRTSFWYFLLKYFSSFDHRE